MAREAATALAVLAIYVLTLLAPLHQARATQLGFAELGYSTIAGNWALCVPDAERGSDHGQIAPKCPLAGVGKSDLAPPKLPSFPLRLDRVGQVLAWTPAAHPGGVRQALPPCGSRAPPQAA